MQPIELLQQLGLGKYEADAYYTLLAEGPLTGYELGKRSGVPLSRSYEILERLHARGLALLQPGEPPRYVAEDHGRFLAGIRAGFTEILEALAVALADAAKPLPANDFWVLRGRHNILGRLGALIAGARRSVDLQVPAGYEPMLAPVLAAAPASGQRIFQPSSAEATPLLLALIDGQEPLAGLLDPVERCQAVTGSNPALLALMRGHFAAPRAVAVPMTLASAPPQPTADWIEWEARKQRRLWRLTTRTRSA